MYANINAERARNNMTIEELSKKIGISVRTYYAWQENGNIPATKLIALADKLLYCNGYTPQETTYLSPGDLWYNVYREMEIGVPVTNDTKPIYHKTDSGTQVEVSDIYYKKPASGNMVIVQDWQQAA